MVGEAKNKKTEELINSEEFKIDIQFIVIFFITMFAFLISLIAIGIITVNYYNQYGVEDVVSNIINTTVEKV